MNIETRKLLEESDKALDRAYKNARFAIADLKSDNPDDSNIMILWVILNDIDKAKVELEKILEAKSGSDVEMFELVAEWKRTVFSEANHV